MQANGAITIVGSAYDLGFPGFTISGISSIRLTATGQTDNTFTPFEDGFYNDNEYTGEAVVLQNGNDADVTNDRIVLIGSEHHHSLSDNDDMFAVRLTNTGAVDRTFFRNGLGVENYIGFGANEYASAAVVENDGSSRNGDIIIVGQSVADGGTSKFAIARLRASDGQPDTSFSGDGKVTSAFVSEAKYNKASAVVVQPNGSIVVAGIYSTTHQTATDTHLGVFRLKADGSGDSTFGVGNGQITLDAGAQSAAMTASQSGDLLIDTLLGSQISISALTADGRLDTVFSGDGKQTIYAGGSTSSRAGIATENDGTFVVAGGADFLTAAFYDRAKVTVYINSNDSVGFEDTANGGRTMSFYIHQFETLPSNTKVYFSTGGTASGPLTIPRTNIDYTGLPTSILSQYIAVPAGSNSVTTTLVPVDDARPEADETATITLIPQPGVYDIGGPSNVTLTIYDNDGQRLWGQVYNDANGNGKFDDNKFLGGVTVYLDANNNGDFDTGEKTTVTYASGVYRFYAVPLGTNVIRQIAPTGFTQSDPVNNGAMVVTVAANKNYDLNPFGDKPAAPAPNGKISGFTFNDANKNGKYDTGDSLASGKTVWIDLDDDGVIDPNEAKATTDSSGNFTFTGLAAGTYHVRRSFPAGYAESTPARYITLTSGQAATGVAIGSKTA